MATRQTSKTSSGDITRNFYLRYAYSLQASYDKLKDFALETEYITLFKEEIEVLSKEGEVSEEEQQVLNNLKDRINSAIELYNGDGALIKINDRSAKDAMLERTEESFVQSVRDSVINSLEVEKQTVCAYSIWKDIESQPGVLKRGMNKLRASFRRRGNSASSRRRPKLEEDKKEGETKDETPAAATEEGEPKPAEGEAKPAEGETPPKQEDGEASGAVTVEVQMETGGGEAAAEGGEAEAKDGEQANKEEPAKEAEPEQPKVEETQPKEDGEKKEEGAGEVQPAEDKKDESKTEEDEVKSKDDRKVKRSASKKKKQEVEQHRHKAAKDEPLDNRVLRAFGRVMGGLYQVQDGEGAIKQLRSSIQIRSCLNSLKPFAGLDGVQVSVSVIRWNSQISDNRGMIFRGFVYKNELCAISQFDDTVYFPNVVHYKDTVIRSKIRNFFDENIKSVLTDLNSYIIDFFVGPEKTYVIRLNPFITQVGACLFTWTDNTKDLTRGPVQLRVVENPKMSPEAFSSYQENWREMLQSVVTQRAAESRASRSGSSCVIL